MRIIIVGINPVGIALVRNLVQDEQNDITLVANDAAQLRQLQARVDIRTVHGLPSHPNVLERAGAEDADILMAVTDDDEVNMVACQVAHSCFRTPTKICRIRSRAYSQNPALFGPEGVPVDILIRPEEMVTDAIRRLLKLPGALQVLNFAEGRVQLVAVTVTEDGPIAGHKIGALHARMPDVDCRVAAIYRQNHPPLIPQGDTTIETGDEVFFIAETPHIAEVMRCMRPMDPGYRNIVIAGGGQVGERLIANIEDDYHVRVIEKSMARCTYLSEELKRTIVLCGDAADSEFLHDIEIQRADVFCALTNDDAANIMSALLAKNLGVRKVISLVNDDAYTDLVHSGTIDIALSARQFTVSEILAQVRQGDLSIVHSLRRGAAEAIELVVHGDRRNSRVIGRALRDIQLPVGVTIGALVRGDQVLIAHGNTVIEADDHVILFVVDKKCIKQVDRLFQADFSFF